MSNESRLEDKVDGNHLDADRLDADHLRRVQGLTVEIGKVVGIEKAVRSVIYDAAWLNDDGCSPSYTRDLLKDLKAASDRGWRAFPALTPDALTKLIECNRRNGQVHVDPRAYDILAIATEFDEAFESLQLGHHSAVDVIKCLARRTEEGAWPDELFQAFLKLSTGTLEQALLKAETLPVQAVAVIRKLAVTPIDDLPTAEIAKLASQDPILATELLRAANSAHYPSHERISSILGAVNYIGALRAKQVMLAAAVRGLFVSAHLRDLWKHSLECATKMSRIASRTGCNPEEAFLVGLLHDIGRVALELTGNLAKARLRDTGAPAIWIELITAGCDHATLGGMILSNWKFSEDVVDAITYHHSPELAKSKLAALMYASEFVEDTKEDLKSRERFEDVIAAAGISCEDLSNKGKVSQLTMVMAS